MKGHTHNAPAQSDKQKAKSCSNDDLCQDSVDMVLGQIVETGLKSFQCPIGAILMAGEDGLKLSRSAGIAKDQLGTGTLSLDDTFSGEIYKKCKPLLVEKVEASPLSETEPYYTGSLISAPLVHAQECLGLLNFCRPPDRAPFGQESVQQLTVYADQSAFALACQQHIENKAKKLEEHSREMEEKFNDLNRKLLAVSRQAGMTEVATGILHNVGNVLNSINVSVTLLSERTSRLRVDSLEKATKLLEDNKDNLVDFLTNDERGKHLPAFLSAIAEHLTSEQKFLLNEIQTCVMHVGHVKNVISTQQMYAKHSGIDEITSLDEVIDSALSINSSSLKKYDIDVIRLYEAMAPVCLDRHKLIQVLVNLISNARNALKNNDDQTKRELTIRSQNKENTKILIEVIDSGVGISPENIDRVFDHGFTTRKDGNGFGLHSSSLAATEMGGSLSCHSEGLGKGATFLLELPYKPG